MIAKFSSVNPSVNDPSTVLRDVSMTYVRTPLISNALFCNARQYFYVTAKLEETINRTSHMLSYLDRLHLMHHQPLWTEKPIIVSGNPQCETSPTPRNQTHSNMQELRDRGDEHEPQNRLGTQENRERWKNKITRV